MQPYPLIQAETKRIHQRRVHGRSAKMARRGKACVYTYWKTLGRRIGRLSKNTRRPFEKPPRHNLLSPFSPPSSPIESPIHDCARNLDQGPSCRCLPTRNSDIATQRFALTLFTQRAPFPPHHRWTYVCVCARCNGRVHVSPMRMHVHRRKRERGVNTEWTLASEHEVWWTTDSACEGRGEGREGGRSMGGSAAFAWKVSRSINGFWVKNWIIHLSRSGCLAAAGRTCGWIKAERIVSVKRYKTLPQE